MLAIGAPNNAPLAAGENYVGRVGLTHYESSTEITRPSDTTAYSAKDVLSDSTSAPTVLTFTGCARVAAGSGYVCKGRIFTDSATALLGTVFRLHLYHTAPTAVNDNAQFPLLYANKAKRVGYIDFPALATEGTGSDSAAALWVDLPVKFTCAAVSTSLYGMLEVITVGAAPASGQKVYVAIDLEQH